MGNSKNLKELRGQIRQIVKELLPDILSKELVDSIQRHLTAQLREGLDKIDSRQADLQSYFIRNTTAPAMIDTTKSNRS